MIRSVAILATVMLAVISTVHAQKEGPEHQSWGAHIGPQPPVTATRSLQWETQAEIANSHPGWHSWLQDNPQWRSLFDERTGQLEYAFGPGIYVTAAGSQKAEIAVAANTLAASLVPQFTTAEPSEFELFSILKAGKLWYVHFVQRFGMFKVEGSRLTLRIDEQGRLVMFGLRHIPTTALIRQPNVDPAGAFRAAQLHLRSEGYLNANTVLTRYGTDAVVHVKEDRAAFTPTLAWKIQVMASEPRADWVIYVDARSGQVFDYYNDIRECGCTPEAADGHEHDHDATCGHSTVPGPGPEALQALMMLANINGLVQGTTHEGLLPSQTPQMTSFFDLSLTINGTSVLSDSLGAYSYNGGGATVSVSSGMDSPWINGSNLAGANAQFTGSASTGVYDVTFTDAISNLAERDMVYFTNKTHARLKAVAPQITIMDNQITGVVNSNQTCNATYSPAAHRITFYQAGGGCDNTAYMASVVSHEYGHGVSTRLYNAAGQGVPGHLGEGYSDCIGGATEDDSVTGRGFSLGSTNGIRNMNNTCQYPSSCGSAIHSRGLVIGGSYWSTRVEFANAFGQAGKDQMDGYLFQHLSGAPNDETVSVLEFLLLDDDDGNLTNGTPNIQKFYTGFTTAHGVPFPIQLLGVDHQVHPASRDQLSPYIIRASINSLTNANITNAFLFYRVGGSGAFSFTNMVSLGGSEYEAQIPNALGMGPFVEYYISAGDTGSNVGTSPADAPTALHRIQIEPTSFFYSDGFESNTGWVSVQVQQQNDWQRGTPGNTNHPNDPPSAYEGSSCYGNDLSIGNFNGNYQNNVHNHLTSPTIDCSGRTGVSINYRRWLTVEEGIYDNARIQVSNNNGATFTTVWENPPNGDLRDTSWVEHVVDISAIADNQAQVRVRFQLVSDGGVVFGGWSIDDFKLESAITTSTETLTSSGSSSVGNTFVLEANGNPGDLVAIAFAVNTAPTFYAGVGTLSLNIADPSFIVVDTGTTIPASGTLAYPLFVPNAVGLNINFQALKVSAGSNELSVSNVLSATIVP